MKQETKNVEYEGVSKTVLLALAKSALNIFVHAPYINMYVLVKKKEFISDLNDTRLYDKIYIHYDHPDLYIGTDD